MTAPERMHRLLMGDVGTGKTVVALFAMLLAVENDFQAALMAPTELLAEQHAATLEQLLAPLEHPPRAAAGPADRRREGRGPGAARVGAGAARGRHPRADAGERLVPPARPGRDRRAAPLRRRAAGGADRERRGTRRPAPHRHADPALARAHAVRRSRRVHPAGTPAGPGHGPHRGARARPSASGCSSSSGRSAPRAARPTWCCRSSRSRSGPTCAPRRRWPRRWRRAGPSCAWGWCTAGSRPTSATR